MMMTLKMRLTSTFALMAALTLPLALGVPALAQPATPATDAETAAAETKALDKLYETARSGGFANADAMKALEEACNAFAAKWSEKLPAASLVTARTYIVRCKLTAGANDDVAKLTKELLALEGLTDTDRYKLLFYQGCAAVAKDDAETAKACVAALRKLKPDIASALNRQVAQKWAPIKAGEVPPQWELGIVKLDAKDGVEGALKLADLRGKYVLLDFWATWCGPCRAVMEQELAPLHKVWAEDDRFVLISVGTNWSNDTAEKQAKFANEKNYHWTKVFDRTGETAENYGVQGIPTLTFIGPDGKVIIHDYAAPVMDVVKKTLAKLAEERAPGKKPEGPKEGGK